MDGGTAHRTGVRTLVGILVILSLSVSTWPGATISAAPGAVPPGKKVCKTVTKKVKGKKQQVKVCSAVKPTAGTALAQQLAKGLKQAKTDTSRYQALLTVLKALHIGVYQADGKALSRGEERSNRDFYLYVPEVRALADAYGRGDTTTSTDLAAMFNKVLPTSTSVDSSDVRQVLQAMTKTAVAAPS